VVELSQPVLWVINPDQLGAMNAPTSQLPLSADWTTSSQPWTRRVAALSLDCGANACDRKKIFDLVGVLAD
jgi:hypothetical protein